jgi:hypothetical protein
VVAPDVSLIPYTLKRGMSREAKYSIEAYFKGAAPKRNISHLSNPKADLILDRIAKLATEYMSGGSSCFYFAIVLAVP